MPGQAMRSLGCAALRSMLFDSAARVCDERSQDISIGSQRRPRPFIYKTQISRNLVCPQPHLHYVFAILTTPFLACQVGHVRVKQERKVCETKMHDQGECKGGVGKVF